MKSLAILAPAALLLGTLCSAGARAQNQAPPDAARLAAARRVLQTSGTVDAMVAGIKTSLPAQRAASPGLPEEFWTRFEARVTQDAPLLADSIALLYARTFTLAELEAFVAFYQSPAGQRLRQMQPVLIGESSQIGQRWGMRIGAEIGTALNR